MDKFGLERSMFVQNGCKSGIVTRDEFVKVCRWVCDKNGLIDVRDKALNVNIINATKRAKSGWIGRRWRCVKRGENEEVIRWRCWRGSDGRV